MTLDWAHFTPWTSLAGGLLLGVAASLFILLHGRILGISGIVGGLLGSLWQGGQGEKSAQGWRWRFLAGLLAAAPLYLLLAPTALIHLPRFDTGYLLTGLAGLLVGVGTRYGGGCTSGHGVCGLSRLSPRSLAATITFMALGFATVTALRHWL